MIFNTVTSKVTEYIWNGSNLAAETNDSTITSIYTYGADGITTANINGNTSLYLKNVHGDVVGITDAEGTVQKNYRYDAFGNEQTPDEADINPFRYCGEYFDSETGQVYLRNRYYAPNIGRFITEDPIQDGLNWYVYVGNNPIMYIDPNGHDTKTLEHLINIAVQQEKYIRGVQKGQSKEQLDMYRQSAQASREWILFESPLKNYALFHELSMEYLGNGGANNTSETVDVLYEIALLTGHVYVYEGGELDINHPLAEQILNAGSISSLGFSVYKEKTYAYMPGYYWNNARDIIEGNSEQIISTRDDGNIKTVSIKQIAPDLKSYNVLFQLSIKLGENLRIDEVDLYLGDPVNLLEQK